MLVAGTPRNCWNHRGRAALPGPRAGAFWEAGLQPLTRSLDSLHRTSKLTAAPATTFCPAAGDCDTTTLAGVA